MSEEIDKRSIGGKIYPSGSSLGYLADCMGRFQAEQDFPSKSTNDSDLGTRIHFHLSEETPEEELPDDCEFAVVKARVQTEILRKEFNIQGQVFRENRLWLYENGEPKFSGEIDFYEVNGVCASIIDYKTLFGWHPPAEVNRQLQIYAVLLMEKYPDLELVKLGLVQPLLDKVTTSVITADKIKQLRKQLVQLVDRAMQPDAPRNAGVDQCKYCNALSHCPEAWAYILKYTKEHDMENINNEELSEKMAVTPLLERFIKEVKDLVKGRLEKNIEVPNYKLRSSGKITSFKTVESAKTLFDANLTIDEFLACCTIKEPLLIKAWQKYTGLPAKKAKDDLRTRLENSMIQKEKAKSILKT